MRSNAGMTKRQGDVDLREAQVSAQLTLWLGLARLGLKMGPTGFPETSLRNFHCTVRNIPEESSSRLICLESLI